MAKLKPTPAHPYAKIFSLHDGEPLYKLSDSIKEFGQRDPIVLLDGQILDGRRREMACYRAGVDPKYREFGSRPTDGDDPLEFVFDTNFHRRHLGEAERILAAANYATAKGGRPKKPAQLEPVSENGEAEAGAASNGTVAEPENPTVANAAEKFGETEADVKRGKIINEKGTKKLQEAVRDRVITISDAAKVAIQPAAVQNEAVEKVRNGEARSATTAAKEIAGTPAPKKREVLKDPNGVEVPAKLRGVLGDPWLRETMDLLAKLGEKLRERRLATGAKKRAKFHPFFDAASFAESVATIDQTLDIATQALANGRPWVVCPSCGGKKCKECKQSGLVPKWVYDALAKGEKAAKGD